MTLYPVFSKYGMGDKINGKTVVYVRNGSKLKISMGSFSNSLEFDVTGNWMYLAVDDNAGYMSKKNPSGQRLPCPYRLQRLSEWERAAQTRYWRRFRPRRQRIMRQNTVKVSAQALCPRAANCILSIKRLEKAKSPDCRRIRRRKMHLDSSTLIFGRHRRRMQPKPIP